MTTLNGDATSHAAELSSKGEGPAGNGASVTETAEKAAEPVVAAPAAPASTPKIVKTKASAVAAAKSKAAVEATSVTAPASETEMIAAREELIEKLKTPEELRPILRKLLPEEIMKLAAAMEVAFNRGAEEGEERGFKNGAEEAGRDGFMRGQASVKAAFPVIVAVCNAADAWVDNMPRANDEGEIENLEDVRGATDALVVAIEAFRVSREPRS